jgi:HEAT repeat protein
LIDPAAVVLAGHRAEREVVDAALTSSDPAVRRVALGAALRTGQLDIEHLRRGLADVDQGVRLRAIELVCRHEQGVSLLGELTNVLGGEARTAELAAFVIGELELADPAAVAALERQALGHDDALARESAVAALGALHRGRDTILAALSDKATVRRRAVIALAPFDGPDIDAALTRALEDRDWQVRQAAEDLLR